MCQFITFCGLQIGTFPLCAGIGLFCIAMIVYATLRKHRLEIAKENQVMIAIPFSVLIGVVTGYFSDVFFRGGLKAFLSPWGYGMTFYGWLIGNFIFLVLYAKICRVHTIFLLNCFLPTFSIAQAFGRIGCFCGGCCFGRPCAFCGVVYPPGSLPFTIYGNQPLFPVQLLESSYLFIIFIILFTVIGFSKRAAIYLILMSLGRFFFEYLRGDNRGMLGQNLLSPGQCCSCFFFVLGICLMFLKKNDRSQQEREYYEQQ